MGKLHCNSRDVLAIGHVHVQQWLQNFVVYIFSSVWSTNVVAYVFSCVHNTDNLDSVYNALFQDF